MFKIEIKTPYAKDYNTCTEEVKLHKYGNASLELVSIPNSINKYDTVILAYPDYWGTIPMAVFTFLDTFDFSKKKILPLCTNEGSGMWSSEDDIKKLCLNSNVKKELPLIGSCVVDSDKKNPKVIARK